jgi:MFS family permease
MTDKWKNLSLLAIAELLAMSLWFSASAVVPELVHEWAISGAAQSWLTMSVQLGFVLGAFGSAATNLADRVSSERLFAVSALLGASCNAMIALFADEVTTVLGLRFLTGMTLAGVYPPGMKIMATWCKEDRGLGIGLLVGALTVGSASPHLFSVFGGLGEGGWRTVLGASSASGLLAALLAARWVRSGPLLVRASAFSWRHASRGLTDPAMRLANFGYLGHMWELYAMWAWAPLFVLHSYERAGIAAPAGRVAAFSIVAVGGIGALIAGKFADRWGRTTVTMASLAVSGSCCLVAGFAVDSPWVLTGLCLVWGVAAIADSAQFSAAVTELGEPAYVGTALTVQVTMGFLLTLLTIRAVPLLAAWAGWSWAFAFLAVGPLFGFVSMWRLRRRPEAVRLASGNL